MIELIPATADILARFYGKPVTRSMRAIAAVRDGDVLGVAGVFVDESRQVVFSSISEELKAHPRLIVRAYRIVLAMARESALQAHAVCDPAETTARHFLEHIGFQKVNGDTYQLEAVNG